MRQGSSRLVGEGASEPLKDAADCFCCFVVAGEIRVGTPDILYNQVNLLSRIIVREEEGDNVPRDGHIPS